VSKVAKDRTFNLTVTTFEAPRVMVWEDGNSMFLVVQKQGGRSNARPDGSRIVQAAAPLPQVSPSPERAS
jgi:hypothetical protein